MAAQKTKRVKEVQRLEKVLQETGIQPSLGVRCAYYSPLWESCAGSSVAGRARSMVSSGKTAFSSRRPPRAAAERRKVEVVLALDLGDVGLRDAQVPGELRLRGATRLAKGGEGFMETSAVARYWRQVKINEIGEGTSDINRQIIARSLLSEERRRRG